jgi:hypothetical protein
MQSRTYILCLDHALRGRFRPIPRCNWTSGNAYRTGHAVEVSLGSPSDYCEECALEELNAGGCSCKCCRCFDILCQGSSSSPCLVTRLDALQGKRRDLFERPALANYNPFRSTASIGSS